MGRRQGCAGAHDMRFDSKVVWVMTRRQQLDEGNLVLRDRSYAQEERRKEKGERGRMYILIIEFRT